MKNRGFKKHYSMEAILATYIKYNKKYSENIVGLQINELHMEVKISNKIKVDLIGLGEDGSIIIDEISIRDYCNNDFQVHKNQIFKTLEFIGSKKFVHFIVMATQFRENDINEIESFIEKYNVKMYFVLIPKEFLLLLENSTDENIKPVYNNFKFTDILLKTSKFININDSFVFSLDKEDKGSEITNAILQGLRKEVKKHIALHLYKDLTKNKIRIGSGIADVMFNIYCNKKDKIKIEINFAKRFEVFDLFKKNIKNMSDYISYPLQISSKGAVIFSEIPNEKKEIVINNTVKVAKKYIEYVSERLC